MKLPDDIWLVYDHTGHRSGAEGPSDRIQTDGGRSTSGAKHLKGLPRSIRPRSLALIPEPPVRYSPSSRNNRSISRLLSRLKGSKGKLTWCEQMPSTCKPYLAPLTKAPKLVELGKST